MAEEKNKIQLIIEAINLAGKAVAEAKSMFTDLGTTVTDTGKKTTVAGKQGEQSMMSVGGQLSKLNALTKKFGLELQTIDLYLISGFKVIALYKLVQFIGQSVNAFGSLQDSMRGVQIQALKMGQDIEQSTNLALKHSADGIISIAESATTVKNLLARGNPLADIDKMIPSMKAMAITGRQMGLTIGQAVATMSEGLRNGLSNISDNAGLTKNLEDIWKDYGITLNKTLGQLTPANKLFAESNYIIGEGSKDLQFYAQTIDGVSGAKARLSAKVNELKIQIGQGLFPATVMETNAFITMIQKIEDVILGFEVMALGIKGYTEIIFKIIGTWSRSIIDEFKAIYTYLKSWSDSVLNLFKTTQTMTTIVPFVDFSKMNAHLDEEIQTIQEVYRDAINKLLLQPAIVLPKLNIAGTASGTQAISSPELRKLSATGKRVSDDISYNVERGISEAIYTALVGEKGGIKEAILAFAKSLARAVSDALGEAIVAILKPGISSMLTSFGMSAASAAVPAVVPTGGLVTGGLPTGGSHTPSMRSDSVTVNVSDRTSPRAIGTMVESALMTNKRVQAYLKGLK